jgi:hypothetical protein
MVQMEMHSMFSSLEAKMTKQMMTVEKKMEKLEHTASPQQIPHQMPHQFFPPPPPGGQIFHPHPLEPGVPIYYPPLRPVIHQAQIPGNFMYMNPGSTTIYPTPPVHLQQKADG